MKISQKMLRIGDFYKLSSFESAILIFFSKFNTWHEIVSFNKFFHFRIKMNMNYSKSSFFCILQNVMFREAGWSNEFINYASNLLVNAQCLNDFQMIFL